MQIMVAGSIRRSAVNLEIKNLPYLIDICLRAKDARSQCLFALLYLSGRRVEEVLHLKKSDIMIVSGFMGFVTFNEKCFRKQPQGIFSYLIKGPFYTWSPKLKKRVQRKEEERYYEKISCDFSTTSEAYKSLGVFVKKYLDELGPDDHLFPSYRGKGHIHYQMAYKIIRFMEPDIWPHWIRHQRFSAVTEQLKDLPTADLIYSLKDFTKHHRTDSTIAYIHRMRNIEIRRTI